MFWAEAGAAPNNNIIGLDPGLRDPQSGDFQADLAVGYGCRVFAGGTFSPVGKPAGLTTPPAFRAEPAPDRAPLWAASRPGRQVTGGIIDKDTLWDAAFVQITDDVEIIDGATLTVAPGVRVAFSDFWGLTVRDGSLQAIGSPQEPIVWTSERSDLWRPDEQTDGAWRGLAFLNVPAVRDSSRLRWCVLEHAKALSGGIGGAVRVVGGSPLLVSHCILRNNLAERGGAVAARYGASPLLVNNLFHDNHALLRGAGIYASNSYPVLVHNTFTANVTTADPFVHTGCLDHAHAKPLHIGGIVWGNPTGHYANTQIRGAKAYYTRYCSIEDWLGGEGCQTDDPLLDDESEPPYQPRPNSPIIDAGNAAAAVPWLPVEDLAGGMRLVGVAPDIGAYEFSAATSAATSAPKPLLSGAPNPFNPQVFLAWDQGQPGEVCLTIHDARGRLVRTLVRSSVAAGPVRMVWDGTDDRKRRLPAGVYLARLQTASGYSRLKLVMVP